MKHRSKYRCECCGVDVEARAIVCSDCLQQFYWLHSLWMAGLNQTKAPTAMTQERDK
jgi:hypothetical protein